MAIATHVSSNFQALLTLSRIYVLMPIIIQMDTRQNVVMTTMTPDLSSPFIANGGGCMIAVLFEGVSASLIAIDALCRLATFKTDNDAILSTIHGNSWT